MSAAIGLVAGERSRAPIFLSADSRRLARPHARRLAPGPPESAAQRGRTRVTPSPCRFTNGADK